MATSPMFFHCNPFFISVISIIIIYLLIKLCRKPKSSIRHPPSPLVLPVIGHLHLLSSSLPKSFQTLARRYGSLMRIHIGQSVFVVVSDAAIAKEIVKVHDGEFASRFEFGPAEYNIYKDAGFITGPYGTYWRFMKKLCMSKLFAGPQLDRFNYIRDEEIQKLLKSLMKRSREGIWCDLSGELATMTNNLIFRMTMGRRFAKDGKETWKLVVEIMGLAAKLGVNEVHGLLKKIDLFGNGKKLREALERYDRIVEEIIKDYEKSGGGSEDVMDILLGIYRDKNAELKITRDQIKYFIFELFTASIDTSSAAIQWGMAELINHPEVYKKLRKEIDSVVEFKRLVKESDVPNLPYLQAIAKETLRLHSPVPIFHRECTKDCKINGYDLQVKDRVLINAYAIMRHPEAWKDPDKYCPERFLGNSGENSGAYLMENKDLDFWFLPFGGGRRACAGSLHAYIVMHGTVGALIQCFDWKIKGGEKVDITVGSGFSGAMALPMECYPILRFDPFQK